MKQWTAIRRLLSMLLAIICLTGCARDELFRQESYVFGTRVEVVVYGHDPQLANEALAAVLREFDRLHRAYHAWEPSELTELNEAIEAGRHHQVSAELATLLADARRLSALGDGLFEPAIGRLIELWGFHSDTFRPKVPDAAAVRALVARRPRILDLVINGRTVSSSNRFVRLDLGGYAKGYALDRAARILRDKGIENALVNIGGNVLALGAKGDRPWRIGIQHPRDAGVLASLPLYDGEAVGTSGDYQRYFEVDGVRYSHLIDPRDGRPARGTQSLTVLVTRRPGAGTLSDAASKPLFIANDGWPSLAGRYDVAHVLRVDDQGRITVSSAMHRRLSYHGEVKPAEIVE
ncbi:MAG: FAD:protein FMN transferase [Rhodocyclaceae bacterium]|nr:FAD:protein FMN transferase [Rhodocyclaceae bacterium]